MQKIVIENKPSRQYDYVSYLVTKMPRLVTYRSKRAVARYLQKLQKSGKSKENFGANCRFCVDYHVTDICGIKTYILNPKGKNTIVYLHGGAYVNTPTRHHMNFAGDIGKMTNCKVLVPYYPLAPFADVTQAIKALVDFATQQKDNFVLLGDSAGGGIVFSLLYKLEQLGLQDKVVCSVALSPCLDFSIDGSEQVKDRMLSKRALWKIAKFWCGDLSPKDPLVSPARANFKTNIKALIIVGGREALKVDAQEFLQNNFSHDITYVEYINMEHDFALYPVPERSECLNRISKYILDNIK